MMASTLLYLKVFIYCLFSLLYLTTPTNAIACPSGCICIHKAVRCMRLQLTKIPDVPSDTNIIDLRYNRIRDVPFEAFGGMPHLHTIFLNENQVSTINSNAFRGLSSLKYLYLNKNRITRIAKDAFNGLNRLQSLYLQFNYISTFTAESFSGLQRLERLFLNNNKISHIPVGAFQNMPALKRLRLDSNIIVCDCSIMWLMKMFKHNKNNFQAAITCKYPNEMNGKNLINMTDKDFNCSPPTITEQPTDVEINFGGTARFNCRAVGDPKPDIIWMQNSNEIPLNDPRYHLLLDGTLKIENADESVMGQYECMAKNTIGEVKSRTVRMIMQNNYYNNNNRKNRNININNNNNRNENVNDGNNFYSYEELPFKPYLILAPFNAIVLEHETITLHCVGKGMPKPQTIWYVNGRPISQSTNNFNVYENGTLVIKEPTANDTGTYKCEVANYLGTVSAMATVKVNEPPKIIIPPENQTINSGTNIVLNCVAKGEPNPKIWWKLNEQPIGTTNRIYFGNDNKELHIEHIKPSDSGKYVCIAENQYGMGIAVAEIKVRNTWGPPKLIFEPYDIDAIPGTTIELPCQGDGDPLPEIKWKKDGKTLVASAKYRIAAAGSLYIKKITNLDAGRYECTIVNEHGRATASGLVTISNTNEVLAPGDRYVRIAYTEASNEIDLAINQTIASLFGKDGNGTGNGRHHGDLFKLVRYPNAPTRELARAAEIYERTLVNIRKHVDAGAKITHKNMTDFNYKDILSPDHLDLVAQLSGCMAHRIRPNCTNMCFHLKYRSIDGTCNNLQNPTWGASLTGFRRILKPIYENGFSMPIGWTKGKLYYGFKKPSARLVSTSVISTNQITPDDSITHMVMQWGQFLDHDLDHAIPSVSSESWDGVDCKKTCEYAAPCYPIEVPENDPRIKNRRCIDLVRSSAICGSGMTSVFFDAIQPREQINQLTAYIDASQIYGYTTQFSKDLRNLTTNDGLLRVGVHFPNQKSMLPFAAPTDGIDCRRNLEESNINCFVAGDIRVNEQIGLAAMHTIWLREHNRIAEELKQLNPHWDGETIYQETRKIVGAEIQHITYAHWLPHVLGGRGMELLGDYKGYDPNVQPSISNEFASAALRFGHTLINPILHRLNETFEPIEQGHLPVHKAFFAPWRLVYEGGVDPLMRGLYTVAAKLKLPQQNLNTELTEKLFFTAHAVALDLAAINIQRAREHGIPGYNEYRRVCNLTVAETFDDLKMEISDDVVRTKLQELYGHPGNIDLFVGGILEDQIDGARIGPVFRCILIEQFKRLRDGDRHWYENPSVFRAEQLTQIKLASLGRILCDNGDNITKITDNVFVLPTRQGGYKQCNEIPTMHLSPWINCDKCSAHQDSNGRTIDPNTLQIQPNIPDLPSLRQRRSLRAKRDTNNYNNNNNNVTEFDYDENFIDMNDERIEGLESLIDTFQKTLKQMRKRLKKLEQNCNENNNNNNNNNKLNKPQQHGHCIDDNGNRRLRNEIWSKDNCTRCECKHHLINCITEKCPPLNCTGENVTISNISGECCAKCSEKNPTIL